MKHLVKKVYDFIRSSVYEMRYLVLKYATTSILLVHKIRDAVNDSALDVIVHLTASGKDDELLKKLRLILNTLFPVKDDATKTDEQIIKSAILNIRKLAPEMQNAAYFKIASLLLQSSIESENKVLENSDTDLIAQLAFSVSKNKISL